MAGVITENLFLRNIVLTFLKKINFPTERSNPFRGISPDIEREVLKALLSRNLGLPQGAIEKFALLGSSLASTAYGHTPTDVQRAIALYSACTFMTDDNVVTSAVLREFVPRLLTSRPQLHAVLTLLVDCMGNMAEHYPDYSANAIFSSTLDNLNAEMFNRDQGAIDLEGSRATEFVDFFRWKTSAGEAFAVFIWPRSMFPETKTYIKAVPFALQFMASTNDLLSYYKEAKAGETDNYVTQYADAQDQPITRILHDLAARLSVLDSRIKSLLGASPEKQAWQAFAIGFTEFHLNAPRYRMKEIIPELYHE